MVDDTDRTANVKKRFICGYFIGLRMEFVMVFRFRFFQHQDSQISYGQSFFNGWGVDLEK